MSGRISMSRSPIRCAFSHPPGLGGRPSPFNGLIEFATTFAPRRHLSHVLFDFDGTISILREGWLEIMLAMFSEMLPPCGQENESRQMETLRDDILLLTGRPTIDQMALLAERLRERGKTPREASWYKQEFSRRLEKRVHERRESVRRGGGNDRFLVHAVRGMLDELQRRGFSLYLASGTDETAVRHEAELLDVARYFGPHIYGAHEPPRLQTKRMVIDRLLDEHRVKGENLIAFGDGHVEIEEIKAVGGLAVAVASDETGNGSGRMDEQKRRRLLAAGADVVIPDYRDASALLDCVIGA